MCNHTEIYTVLTSGQPEKYVAFKKNPVLLVSPLFVNFFFFLITFEYSFCEKPCDICLF